MKGSQWSRYLEEPSRLVQEEEDPLGSIATLLQRSPYSHVLQLLQCKALKDSDRIDWKEKARERSVLVPDRRRLFQLLEESIQEPSQTENEEKRTDSEAKPEEPTSHSQYAEQERSPEAEQIDPAPMEQEILSEAVQNRILYDAEDALIEEEGNEQGAGSERSKKGKGDQAEEDKSSRTKRFSDWLENDGKEAEEGKEAERSDQELIQDFIKEEKEHPVKHQEDRAFFSSERMAEKSSDESTLPVSETLAELYAKQGDLKRAIEAFEKLRLKVPEKSSYFGGRIQELKESSKR